MPKWDPNCAADVSVRGARARAPVQEHHGHNWDPVWAYLGPGRPGGLKNLKKPIKVNVNPSKTTKKDHHICQTQDFGPRTWVWGQMWQFWVVLVWEGFTPKVTTSGPNLSFWAQNQGFGPDVFILKCSNWISRRHHEHRGVFLGSEFAS